jgi:hypothetical protein
MCLAADALQKPRQARKAAPGGGGKAAAARIGATLEGWLSELGGQQDRPELCVIADTSSNAQQGSPSGYWRFDGGAAGPPSALLQ